MATRDKKNRLEGALPRLSDYMLKWAKELPDHDAFIYHDTPISYKEFSEKSQQLAKYFLKIGVQKGDRLAYIMVGRPEFFYYYMAASMVGAIIVGMNTRYTAPEMLYILNNSEASHILSLHSMNDIEYQAQLAKIMPQAPSVDKIWIVGGNPELPNAQSFDEIMKGDYSEYDQALWDRQAEVGSEDGLIIVYTSGTTGQPKGALMSHRNVISMTLVELDEFGAPTGCSPQDIWHHQVPVNHVSGATEWGATPIVGGCTQVLVDAFIPRVALENVAKYKVTIFAGVPTMWAMMLSLPDFKKYDLSSVRFCMVGGSMAPKDVLAKMMEITPYCSNPLGLTETSGLITYTDVGASIDNLNQTVGKCPPEFEMKIVDKDRKPVANGIPGEIAYRGPTVIKEYFKLPEATASAIDQEGWLYSGDVGLIDENGDLRLVGRSKEMYITGGFNVYPAEIEEQISRYPGVQLVAVVPVPHKLMGEVGRAYIVPQPSVTLDGDAIREYLKDYLADYKIPRQYIFRDNLPMTTLGKIEKKILRQKVEEEFSAQQ